MSEHPATSVGTDQPRAREAPEARLIDLRHLGRERVIGSWLVGDVLVDPGPASCLPALLEGLDGQVPRALALTHIHLDHAGAAGTLARRFPELEIWVHERGAPHLADPSRLIASATRLYGADMERLWGEILPVPAERLRALSGGERFGGFRVAYTPGHASHHVAYLYEPLGWAFTGDVAGVRVLDSGPALPPTPPPEVDLELWRGSLEQIEAWHPTALVTTHFGLHADVDRHLSDLRARLQETEERARALGEEGFVEKLRADMDSTGQRAIAEAYEQAMPPTQTYQGLERYLRKRAERRA
jgi:glyoxylase-like metal-dependent hydrolase (beta-lactamase superfamily II)